MKLTPSIFIILATSIISFSCSNNSNKSSYPNIFIVKDKSDGFMSLEGLNAIDYQGCVSIEGFTPEVKELAGAVCIWESLADDQDEFAKKGLSFLKVCLHSRSTRMSLMIFPNCVFEIHFSKKPKIVIGN